MSCLMVRWVHVESAMEYADLLHVQLPVLESEPDLSFYIQDWGSEHFITHQCKDRKKQNAKPSPNSSPAKLMHPQFLDNI